MLYYRGIIVILLSFTLLGCTASAVVTGAGLAYDHYRVERSMNDRYLYIQASHLIYRDVQLSRNSDISITVFDKTILLTGYAKRESYRQQAENLMMTLPNIKRVYNFIEVKKGSAFGASVNDNWITTSINSKLLLDRNIDAGNLKVVTENSTVYLLGIVSHKQAAIVTNIAKKTAGVKHIVTMFEYMQVT